MIQAILLGLVVTIIASVLLYAFRVRQLYVVLPCLFSESALTSTGKLVEIRIFNKSRITEEEVLVELSPDRRYEIVASTDSTPILAKTTIRIPRIPPGDDLSVLIMVEGGNFTRDEISTISSKTTKGSIADGVEQVPPNAGTVILVIAFLLALVAIPIGGISTYQKWKEEVSERELVERIESFASLIERGWTSLERYALSDLSGNYNAGEFPLFQKSMMRDGDVIIVSFSIINKSAAPLAVRATPERPFADQDPRSWENTIIELSSVRPGETSELALRVFWPKNEEGKFSVEFHLDSGSDRFIQVKKHVQVSV